MVGKPNLPSDTSSRQLHGAARVTRGLSPLDEEREASMADEGGASGALMEGEEEKSDRDFRRRSVIGEDTDFQAEDLKDEPVEYEESLPFPIPLWMIPAVASLALAGIFGWVIPYFRERSRQRELRDWSDQLEDKFKVAS